ncbi:MAG: PadR family transcriptional regulator [Candidatus Doudnabacteria bacterium]|nr:PadR family transcriptional regulator [Candidatus Doudnabacteria bacterium]
MSNELKNYTDNSAAQMRKGTLELSVLLVISDDEVYASDIITKLKAYDLLVVEGTLYPILSRLKDAELVTYTWVESKDGPPRKYYKLTPRGKEALGQMKETWSNINKSINQLIKNV